VRSEHNPVDSAGRFSRDVALVVFVTIATCALAVFALFAVSVILFA
jgi:hypothetical protein